LGLLLRQLYDDMLQVDEVGLVVLRKPYHFLANVVQLLFLLGAESLLRGGARLTNEVVRENQELFKLALVQEVLNHLGSLQTLNMLITFSLAILSRFLMNSRRLSKSKS